MAKMYLLAENEDKIVEASSLDDFYTYIGCNCIDITTRKIGNKYFDIICDDEGLLKSGQRVSAINSNFNPVLVGNLLIAGIADEKGVLTSLTDEDISLIRENLLIAISASMSKVVKIKE